MTLGKLRSLLSLSIVLLCHEHGLEGISLPLGSFSRTLKLTSVNGRLGLFRGVVPTGTGRKSVGVTHSRFQLLTRRLALEDSASPLSTVRRNLSKILGGLILAGPPILELYSRTGSKDSDFLNEVIIPSPSKGKWDDVEHITLVFHGAGGQDGFTDRLMENLKRSDTKASYSSIIDWSTYSTNFLQASFNGQRLGRCTAQELLDKATNLKSVHVIGISVGAFAADSLSAAVKSRRKDNPVYVQLTLLDPFTQRGIFDAGYGERRYGEAADYFQQYLNTDDPVPSTNIPLSKSVCYDITAIRPKEIIPFGHDWPVAYYGQKKNIGLVPQTERLPRGSVIRVVED